MSKKKRDAVQGLNISGGEESVKNASEFAYAELHSDQTRDTACRFLRQLIDVATDRIHT